jgi:hypothetical protein
MGPIDCSETTVTNYQSTLRKIPKDRRTHVEGHTRCIILSNNVQKTPRLDIFQADREIEQLSDHKCVLRLW